MSALTRCGGLRHFRVDRHARGGVQRCPARGADASPGSTWARRPSALRCAMPAGPSPPPPRPSRAPKFAKDKARLEAIVAAQAVRGLVIGLPLNMDGGESPRSQSSRAFARNLTDLGLPILLWDERWSTQAVTRAMIDLDMSRARPRRTGRQAGGELHPARRDRCACRFPPARLKHWPHDKPGRGNRRAASSVATIFPHRHPSFHRPRLPRGKSATFWTKRSNGWS